MFQPSPNDNIYRAIISRLAGIQRNIGNDDVTLADLRTFSNSLGEIQNHIINLQTALSQESWERVYHYHSRLQRDITGRITTLETTPLHSDINDGDDAPLPVNYHGEVGRPKKRIEKEKLQLLVNMGFNQLLQGRLISYRNHM